MMEIVRAVQAKLGCVCSSAIDLIAQELHVHRVEVESMVSFYAYLSRTPQGKVVIRLCNDVIDQMAGAEEVARAFEDELKIKVGQTTPDGQITLEYTPCIGMCDQAPAALVNDVVVTESVERRGAADRARTCASTWTRIGWCSGWATATTPTSWSTRW